VRIRGAECRECSSESGRERESEQERASEGEREHERVCARKFVYEREVRMRDTECRE